MRERDDASQRQQGGRHDEGLPSVRAVERALCIDVASSNLVADLIVPSRPSQAADHQEMFV